jgi:glutamate dehydrogenase (NADP+)
LSDSGGFVHDPNGIDAEKLAWIMDLKNVRRGRISEYVDEFKGATYHEGRRPWEVPCQIALPSATQNEIDRADAEALVRGGCIAVSEGANMPTTPEAVEVFQAAGVAFGPAKAANAGGVATSALEMSQNAAFDAWDRDQVDRQLDRIMTSIHEQCVSAAEEYGMRGNLVAGANIAGFLKVAHAMIDQGVV